MNFFPQPYIEGEYGIIRKKKILKISLGDCFPNIVIAANKQGELSFRQAYSSHSQTETSLLRFVTFE